MDELTLYYRGPLKSNGRAIDKHKIREVFHPQLKRYCSQLKSFQRQFDIDAAETWDETIVRPHIKMPPFKAKQSGDWVFVPIASYPAFEVDQLPTVRLSIQLLRPELPGGILVNGGDIDNRLKTLFDALQIPDTNQADTLDEQPDDQNPMFCLLTDDKQISGVNLQTAQLLDVPRNANEIVLIVEAKIGNGTGLDNLKHIG